MKIPILAASLVTTRCAGKFLLAALVLFSVSAFAGGGTFTWNGASGSTGNWSDGANWGGTAPSDPQNFLNFNGAARTSSTNDFANGSAGYQIYFKSGANAFNLYGNPINFFDFGSVDPNIQNEGAVTNQTINFTITNGNTHLSGGIGILNINLNATTAQGPLTFNGRIFSRDAANARVINVSGSNIVTFNGIISDFPGGGGTMALSQLGTNGTTILTASNTFTGDTTINNGTLRLATNSALASSGNFIRLGDTSGTQGANLNLNGGNNLSTPINVRSGSSGTKIIANTSTTTGNATWAGNLFLDADVTLFANANGSNTLSGSTFDLKNQTLTIDGTGMNIISGTLQNSTGSGKLVKNNTGPLYLNSAASYAGGTTINSGIVQVNSSGAFGTGNVTLNTSANQTKLLLNSVIITNNMTLSVTNPGVTQGVIQAADNTSSTNSGTVTFTTNTISGGNLYGPTTTGLLTMAGPINLINQATTLVVRDGYVRFSGGGSYTNIDIRNKTNSLGADNGISTTAVMDIGGNGSTTVPTAFDLNGFNQTLAGVKNSVNSGNLARVTNSSATLSTLTLAVSGLQVFNGSIVGNLAVTLTGGTQVYSNGSAGGTFAYTGDTTISGGTLKLAAANLLPNGLTRGNMIVTNTGLLDLNTFNQTINSLAGNGTVNTVAGGTPTLTIGASNNVISTFSGFIKNTAGALSILKSGSNTFILTGTNTSGGSVFIDSAQNSVGNDGIFRLTYPGALNGPTNIAVRNQNSAYSTFQLDGTLGNLTVTNPISISGRNNTTAPTIESLAGNNTISGNWTMTVGGSFYQIQCDSGTLTNSGTIPVATPGSTRTFTFTGAGNHWVSGTIQNGTGGGTVSLTKDGLGTLFLKSANTFSGGISVALGNLNLGNNFAPGTGSTISYTAGSVQVGSGVIITNKFDNVGAGTSDLMMDCPTGTGVWAGPVTASGTGSFNPGTSGGVLILTGTGALNTRNLIVPRGTVVFATNANFSSSGSTIAFGSSTAGSGTSVTVQNNAALSLTGANGVQLGGAQASPGPMMLTIQDSASVSAGAQLFDLHNSTSASATSAVNLNGGTLTVGNFVKSQTGGGQTSVLSFNGGALKAGQSSASFLPALPGLSAVVSTNGGALNDNGFNITIAQPLAHDAALGATADGGLTKSGAGVTTLSGANTYSGPTVVNNGTLLLNGSLGTNSVTVNAALSGTGTVNGATRVNFGGTLQAGLGGNDTSALAISNSLALAGNAQFNLNRTNAQTGNEIFGLTTVTYGGTLTVTNVGPALTNGDTFVLFAAAAYAGSFTNVILPALDPSLLWNTNNLAINGSISVVLAISPTSLALSSSKNPSGYLDALTFTATVTPTNATGSVTFFNGATPFSTNNLAAGVATSASISTLPRGTNTITAIYGGDVNYYPSTNSLAQVVTNHPPVVADASFYRGAVASYKIKISDLMTNAADADGDTLSVNFGVSTNGISLTVSNDLALYYNTNLVNDRLLYTVSDGFGGSTSATIIIASAPFITGQNSTVTVSGSTATVSFAGIPGYNYGVQRSTNLTDWATLIITNAPSGGVFDYTDDFSDLGSVPASAYYRLQWNP